MKRTGAQRLARYTRRGRERIQAYLRAEFAPHEGNMVDAACNALLYGSGAIRFYERDGAIRSEVVIEHQTVNQAIETMDFLRRVYAWP